MAINNSSTGEVQVASVGSTPACLRGKAEGEHSDALRSDPNERHLTTEHLLMDLKSRTLSSGFVTTLAQGAQFALNLSSIMVLARLLTPQDFGLVAMVMTVVGFLRVFKEAGLSTATIQRDGITHSQVSNLFWINAALSGAVSVLVAASAHAIAWFYREPRLVAITVALSTTFFLTGLAVQHQALLNRQMRFKVIAAIDVGSMLAGILFGVGMAWLKYGYWSLVGTNLATAAVRLLLTWSACSWRPQSPTRRSGTRPLLSFGANLAAGGFIWSLARGSDGLLIGRFFGPDSVGLYSRAAALLMRPVEQFLGPIYTVFVPALSRLQAQPERYRRTFLQVYEATALTSFPFTGLFLALAHPLTVVVLGPKWEKAAVIFASFTMLALFTPLASLSTWLFASQGRGRDSLLSSLISSSVTVASFIVGLPFGPVGVAIAYSASGMLIQLPLLYHIAGRRGPVTTKDLWTVFFRHLPVWGVVCGATCEAQALGANYAPLTQLLICAPVGLLVGAAFICVYAPARRAAMSLFSIIRELKRASASSSV
jgi:PST family polysaccharide transporter